MQGVPTVANFPIAQLEHCDSEFEAVAAVDFPASQSAHCANPALLAYFPSAQSWQVAADEPGENFPSVQATHASSLVAGVSGDAVPARHPVQEVSEEEPVFSLHLPLLHSKQSEALVAAGEPLYFAAAQASQASTFADPVLGLKVPSAQLVQLGEPSSLYFPCAQA